jgi:putative Holliday junction resolvase
MAVDFGFKKIGIAIGETEFKIASPRPTLSATGALAKDALAIAALAKKEEVELVVVGLPVELSGQEGKMARICRNLGAQLTALGMRVEFVDESYTSVEADSILAEARVAVSNEGSRKKPPSLGADTHGEAAMLILERFQV